MGSSCPFGTGATELAKTIINRRFLKETFLAESAMTRLELKACVLVNIDEFPVLTLNAMVKTQTAWRPPCLAA
jgi:hypothetical protein